MSSASVPERKHDSTVGPKQTRGIFQNLPKKGRIYSRDVQRTLRMLRNAFACELNESSKKSEWYPILKSIGDDIFSEVSKNPQVEDFILSTPPTLLMTHIFLRIAGFTSMGPVSGTLAAYWKSKLGLYSFEKFMAWLEGIGIAPARSTREDQFLETGDFRWVKPREVLTKTAMYAHGSSRYPGLGTRRVSSGMHTKIRADVLGPSRSSLQPQTLTTPNIPNWLPIMDERQWSHRDL